MIETIKHLLEIDPDGNIFYDGGIILSKKPIVELDRIIFIQILGELQIDYLEG